MTTEKESIDRIGKLLSGASTVMFTTVAPDGSLHTRPMQVAGTAGLRLTFFTNFGTGKLSELAQDERCTVAIQDGLKYVAVSGRATFTRDINRAARLWTESQKVWFPKGPTDAGLALIDVIPEHVEYWDMSGAAGVRFAWEALKAYFGERKVSEQVAGEHAKVSLHP